MGGLVTSPSTGDGDSGTAYGNKLVDANDSFATVTAQFTTGLPVLHGCGAAVGVLPLRHQRCELLFPQSLAVLTVTLGWVRHVGGLQPARGEVIMNSRPDAGRWDEVPLSPTPPVGDEYIELSENGWGALIGWCAGPARLIRVPDQVEAHTTRVSCSSPAGDKQYSRPRTHEEQVDIDADINGYLHDGGAPARPAGYRWFLRLPSGYSEDRLWADLNAALPSSAVHPADIAPRFSEVVQRIYSDSGR